MIMLNRVSVKRTEHHKRSVTRARAGSALAVCAIAAMTALSACSSSGQSTNTSGGSPSGTGASKQINILAILDTSGPLKEYGTQELASMRAGISYFDAHGGVDGYTPVLTVLNDNGDPATAVNLAVQELGTNPSKYTMVWPGTESAEIDALRPILERYKLYTIAIADSGTCVNASACPTQFSLLGSSTLAEQKVAVWMKDRDYTKVGILEEQASPFTESESDPLVASLKSEGIDALKVDYPGSAVNLTPEFSQLRSAGVQAIFAEGIGPSAGYELTARAALGWNAPIVFDPVAATVDITKLAPAADIKNAYEPAAYCMNPANNIPAFKLLSQYAPAGSINETSVCNVSAAGWDAIVLLNEALKQAGGATSGTELAQATESLSAAAQADPLYITNPKHGYTASNHVNVAQTVDTFSIVPVSPIADLRLQVSG
jgi:ABC-type branched-subunit amino acid transport system substrate-binding protein